MGSASIIPYPARTPADRPVASGNRLMIRDKIDVCLWEAASRVPEVCRVVIHDQLDAGLDQVDLVLIYSSPSPWARWGLARREGAIMLWRCSDGQELGMFGTMSAALKAVECHAARLRTDDT